MAAKSLKSLIKQVRNDLDWPVLERPHEHPVVKIVSDPSRKNHLIYLPETAANQGTDLDYLHELGHALFCEQVHPVFSAQSHFAPALNKRLILLIIPALNVACDWFIGHWQLERAERQIRRHVRESLPVVEEILGEPSPPPLEVILDISLVIAQAIRYLEEPIDCAGPLKMAVDAFLAVPPDQPTPENCATLVNHIMATYTDHRAQLTFDGEYHVWDVVQPESPVQTVAAAV